MFNIGLNHLENDKQDEALSTWLSVYQLAKPMDLAQALKALSDVAEKIGLPPGLEGWEQMSKEQEAPE